jgi:hypothetical protein
MIDKFMHPPWRDYDDISKEGSKPDRHTEKNNHDPQITFQCHSSRSAFMLQVTHHLFELFSCDLSLGVPLFEYGFSVSVLRSVGVIPSSPGPEEPSYYPEDHKYQEDATKPAKMEREEEWVKE